MEINEVLKALRQQKHLTQQELAALLEINLSSYQKYERPNNTIKPSIESLIKIADFYGVTVDYLLGREQKEAPVIDYEKVKKETDTIIKKIESLPPEYQAFMCKIVRILADAENNSETIGEEQKRREPKLSEQPIVRPTPQKSPQPVQPPIVQSSSQRQIQQAPQQRPNLQRQMPVQQPEPSNPPLQSQIQPEQPKQWRMAARSTDGRYVSRVMTQEEIDLIESLEDVPKDRY